MKPILLALCLAALPSTIGAADPPFEKPPVLAASDFLDAATLKGPHHAVEPKVVSDGVFNTYTVASDYGTFKVEGTSLVLLRVHEIGAIAQLKEVDKIAVAAGGIAAGVVDVGKGVVNIITNPVGTVKGVGGGVVRLFGRIGRGAKRTSEKMGEESKATSPPQNLVDRPDVTPVPGTSDAGKVAQASGDLAKDLIGVNSAMRSWAQKLRVDPYTRNEVLRKELREVAQYDAGGRFSTKLVPGAVAFALGAAATADELIWMKEPDVLVSLNEAKLKAMGAAPEDSRAFRLNGQYNLTRQVRLVTALDALSGVYGRPDFVARAAGAQVDADAQFYTESALLAETFNRTQAPVTGIVANLPGACVLAQGDRFACLFPLDYIAWTEGMAGHFDRITKRVEADFPKARRELWLTGSLSPRTATELKKRGWKLHEKSLSLVSEVPPEPTPVPKPEKS